RADAELPVHLREVPRDRVRAEVELGGDLAVPAARNDEVDDLPLGLGETALVCEPPADSAQLGARSLQPQARAQPLEDLARAFQGRARGALVVRLALHGAEREERPREFERIDLLWLLG